METTTFEANGVIGTSLRRGHWSHVIVSAVALRIDPQVHAELAPLLEAVGQTEPPPVGDVPTRRVGGHRMFEYRVAPEHPDPTPAEDCYSPLLWLAGNASSLGVDPARTPLRPGLRT
jgi:hypothetical protein